MSELAHRLFSTNSLPEIQYLVIPKCGCTFVKNLLWRIDHQGDHEKPNRIHDADHVFPRASDHGYSDGDIRNNEFAFTVFRNPVDRFFSLYFDKVVGAGSSRFVPLRQVLLDGYGLIGDPASIDEHRKNCMILLDWIELNLKGETELSPDPHWTPQGWRMDVIKRFDLKILMLSGVENSIKNLLLPVLPNARELIQGIERNKSNKTIGRDELLSADIDRRIGEIYGHDKWLTHQAWKFWNIHQPIRTEEIPRISQILNQG
ncbi:sulfotransferase family 2 domain-containing protein [Pararhodobacter oceanensis]|uniref:Sulfotransferase family protein n=1 Tax=Pararhodobacter oceanensis TaxID=2172121 RepID=A0A2T8HP93_9RHOB|nr:sulfotransferase family 2 domain-containing protein [Pararhodobacter oceanensis]PVH27240.1 hypothetical protein DDE20_18670 [Pararhodobacter oceanensis]